MSVTKITDAMRNVTAVDATKISGAVPSASLTNVDLSKLEYNQAILAFKVASANQLAKFSMVDQVIDEYQDATGIDASASTNELAGGATTAKYFEGATSTAVTTSSTDDCVRIDTNGVKVFNDAKSYTSKIGTALEVYAPNASDDAAVKVASFGAEIDLYTKENGGLSSALNFALKKVF